MYPYSITNNSLSHSLMQKNIRTINFNICFTPNFHHYFQKRGVRAWPLVAYCQDSVLLVCTLLIQTWSWMNCWSQRIQSKHVQLRVMWNLQQIWLKSLKKGLKMDTTSMQIRPMCSDCEYIILTTSQQFRVPRFHWICVFFCF